ncbi:MAG: hypothetical protein NZ609_10275 [Acidimicrobiales bacterium]|nr:hypothetical protein [Acidimicrobiales bacterium]
MVGMEPPKELEGLRFVGDKRIQRVHDLDSCTHEDAIEEICTSRNYATFGPDELREARNRGYKPASCCP